MGVSDRRVSRRFLMRHDWPNSYVCMTVGRSDMSKFTEGSWQGSFTVNNVTAVRTLADSFSVKTNQEIMMFTAKKKTTHVVIQVQVFRRKPRKLRLLFSHNKKAQGLNKGKRKSYNGKLQL